MNKANIYFFIGTTAELIKIAPVTRELKKRKVKYKIISSSQNELHFEELKHILGKEAPHYIFKMKSFKWPKDIYLRFLVWIIKSIGNFFIYFRQEFKGRKKEILFVVHGDTLTAVVGAIVAKLCRVKLVHIESGLRSFNFLEPFPEELSRFVVSWLADVHFSPGKWSIGNLVNHKGKKINTYSNTAGESIALTIKISKLKKLSGSRSKKKYFILVLHRQEHTLFNKIKTRRIINFITGFAKQDFRCVFIMHKLTRDYLKKEGMLSGLKKNKNLILPDRLQQPSYVKLIMDCEFIATDGGGNQEDAYFLGKPCLILRNRTERIEGLGENAVLSKNDFDRIEEFIQDYKSHKRKRPKMKIQPSKIIVDYLLK